MVIERNELESIEPRQMNLESVTQSEVSQKENYIYIYAYTWNLEKCTEKCICRAGIDADVENRLVDTAGEGAGGMS